MESGAGGEAKGGGQGGAGAGQKENNLIFFL